MYIYTYLLFYHNSTRVQRSKPEICLFLTCVDPPLGMTNRNRVALYIMLR